MSAFREAPARNRAPFDLYVGHFFVDQHERTRHLDTLATYRAWRASGILERTLEAPVQSDSRHHTLLALPDFAGYVVFGAELDILRKKRRPKLQERARRFVLPNSTGYEPPTLDLRRTLAVTNFYVNESGGEPDLARAIAGLRAGLDHLEE